MTDEADKPTDEHEVVQRDPRDSPPSADDGPLPGPFAEATALSSPATRAPTEPGPGGPPSPILDARPAGARPSPPTEPGPGGPPSPILDAPPAGVRPSPPTELPPGPPSPLTGGGVPTAAGHLPEGPPSALTAGPPPASPVPSPEAAASPTAAPVPRPEAAASPTAAPAPRPEAPPAPAAAPAARTDTLWLRQPTTSVGRPAPPAPPAAYLGAPPPPAWPAWPAYAPAPADPDNGKATASLVLGIAGLALWLTLGLGLLFFVNLPLSILAWVLGVQARRRVERGETSRGAGSAKAGVILGIVGVALGAVTLVGWVLLISLANWS